MGSFAGCTTVQPAISYEPIIGTWTGETYPEGVFEHSFAKLEVVQERAVDGEEVGTFTLFSTVAAEEVHCRSLLSADQSDPPAYFMDVAGTAFPCTRHRRYQFRHETENTLQLLIEYHGDEGEWRNPEMPLSRERG
jgi:hypothetical protein